MARPPGVTQNDIAEVAGVAQPTVGRWLNTGIIPSGEKLTKIANHFGVKIESLLGTEAMPAPTVLQEGPPAPLVDEVLIEVQEIRERLKLLEAKLRKLK